MIKSNISAKENGEQGGMTVMLVLKSIGFCYGLTIIMLALLALVVTYMPLPEGIVPTLVLLVSILSIILSGMMVARNVSQKGWLCGSVTGSIYIVTLYLIGAMIFQSFSFGMTFLTMLLIGALSGAFGGIIGVNTSR